MVPVDIPIEGVTLEQAAELQLRLRDLVVEEGEPADARLVAGVDISGLHGDGPAVGAAILLSLPDLEMADRALVEGTLRFPYVPGFLSFREAPLMLEALRRLSPVPDLVIVEGHGRAHPRGLGIASHVGLILGRPTIGFAKSRLVGRYEEPGPEAGSTSPLLRDGAVIGSVIRSKTRVKPVFVSVGHMISLPAAVDTVLRCTLPGQRLPEPIRLAHLAAGEARKRLESK